MTRLRISAAAVLLLFLASAAEGSVVFTFPDPVPHATKGTGAVQLEISSVVVTVGSGNLGFTVNFANPIAAVVIRFRQRDRRHQHQYHFEC